MRAHLKHITLNQLKRKSYTMIRINKHMRTYVNRNILLPSIFKTTNNATHFQIFSYNFAKQFLQFCKTPTISKKEITKTSQEDAIFSNAFIYLILSNASETFVYGNRRTSCTRFVVSFMIIFKFFLPNSDVTGYNL